MPEAVWREISAFYGLDAELAKRFVMREDGDKKQRYFLLSEGSERFMNAQTKMPTRLVLCGVPAFAVANSYHERAPQWSPVAQALPALVALGMRRRISASRAVLGRLLREKELPIVEIREAAGRGEVQGLEALADDQAAAGALRPGSLAVVLFGEDAAQQAPFVALASLTDSMLELTVANAGEIAALMEDLEGQPSMDDLLKEGDDKDSDGGEADAETAMDVGQEDVVTDGDMDANQAASGPVEEASQARQGSGGGAPTPDKGADADVESGAQEQDPGETS